MEEDINTGQDPELTPQEDEEEKELGEQPEETEEEPIEELEESDEERMERLDKNYKALQKGYTISRQDMAELRTSIEELKDTITPAEAGVGEEGEKWTPKTYQEFEDHLMERLDAREQEKATVEKMEDDEVKKYVERQIGELEAAGEITSEDEATDLLEFALEHEIIDLKRALKLKGLIDEAEYRGLTEAEKAEMKGVEGSKVGTSQKATREEPKGADYKEIRTKSFSELAETEEE